MELDEASGQVMGEPVPVPVPAAVIGHLSFSSNGTSIAMASITQSASVEGFAFDPVNGSVGSRPRVTTSSDRTSSVSVSPNGQWLAFSKFQQNNQQDLWVVNRDGTGLRQVTNDAALERVPSWSPDGTRLMFQSSISGGLFQVWTIAIDGSGATQVTDRPESLIFPIWGPDATRALGRERSMETVSVNGVAVALLSPEPGEDFLEATLAAAPGTMMEAAPLVYMKLESPRRKDHVDVIEMVKGGIDTQQCRAYLAANAPALAPTFDECVAQADAEQD